MRNLMLLGVPLGGSAGAGLPDILTFTATTTAAGQTLRLDSIGVAIGQTCTVNWGDGTATQDWTGDGVRTHVYANAGTYAVTVANAAALRALDLRDNKISWTVSDTAPMPAGLTYIYLHGLGNLTWVVGSVAGANMPAGLTSIYLRNLANLTWVVGSVAGANMPAGLTRLTLREIGGLTWEVGSSAGANIPAGLTDMTLVSVNGVSIDAGDVIPASLTTIRYESSLTQARVDAFLAACYAALPTRTGTNGTIDLLGTDNAAPSGVLQAACPPATGLEYAYELVNDSCNVSANHWASVTVQT